MYLLKIFMITRRLNDFHFQMIVNVNISRGDGYDSEMKLIDRKIDACKLGDTISTVPLISIFFKVIFGSMENGAGTFKCPLVAGRFILSNLSFDGFLPLPSSTKICIAVKTVYRIEKERNFIPGMTLRVNFTYDFNN